MCDVRGFLPASKMYNSPNKECSINLLSDFYVVPISYYLFWLRSRVVIVA